MEYPSNVVLLLLQVLLKRQQTLAHQDKSLDISHLLKEPVVDKDVLIQFQTHRIVKIYSPDLCNIQMRSLKSMISDLFERGLPADEEEEEGEDVVDVITLANHYYMKRIEELEQNQLPQLRKEIMEELQH